MARIRPKETLARAKEREKAGDYDAAADDYAQLGLYLLHRERYREARNAFQRATKLNPRLVDAYFRWAIADAKNGDVASARIAMTQFTRAAIRDRLAEKYTWRVENDLSKFPKLRQTFYEALLLVDRTTAVPFIGLARAHRDAGEADSARQALLDGLRTKSHEREILEALRAILKQQARDTELEYVDSYERGELDRLDLVALLEQVEADPDEHTKETEKDLDTLIGELEKEIGLPSEENLDEVEPLIAEFRRRSQSVLKGSSKARIDMATAYFEMGLLVHARDELMLVSPEDVRYGEAQCLLGEVLIAEGSLLEALETYQQCRRLDEPPTALSKECEYRMIQIYIRLGDKKQALVHVREMEKLDPRYRDFRSVKAEVMASLDGVVEKVLFGAKRRRSG